MESPALGSMWGHLSIVVQLSRAFKCLILLWQTGELGGLKPLAFLDLGVLGFPVECSQ